MNYDQPTIDACNKIVLDAARKHHDETGEQFYTMKLFHIAAEIRRLTNPFAGAVRDFEPHAFDGSFDGES